MSRSPEIYPVYLRIQPRAHEVQDTLRTLHSLFDSHPDATASIKGVGMDETTVRLFVELLVPISDRDARSVAALRCAQDIFETLFAQIPSYCPMPNKNELEMAQKFLGTTRSTSEKVPDVVEEMQSMRIAQLA